MRVIAARTLGAVCRPSPPERLCFSPSLVLRPPVSSNPCAHPQTYSMKSLTRPSVLTTLGPLTSHRLLTYDGDKPESCTVGPASFSLDKARMLEASS